MQDLKLVLGFLLFLLVVFSNGHLVLLHKGLQGFQLPLPGILLNLPIRIQTKYLNFVREDYLELLEYFFARNIYQPS